MESGPQTGLSLSFSSLPAAFQFLLPRHLIHQPPASPSHPSFFPIPVSFSLIFFCHLIQRSRLQWVLGESCGSISRPPPAIEWCLCVGVMHHSRPPLLWLPDPTASLGAITPPSSLQSLTPSSVLLTLLTRSIKQGIVALPELLFNNELGFLEH